MEAVDTAFDIWIDEYEGTSYYDIDEVKRLKEDALTLLKKQETVPIPDRIGDKIPCDRCTNMIISESARNFVKSYEYGYITDEEVHDVLKNAAKDSRLHEECAEILIQRIMKTHKPERRKFKQGGEVK